MMADALAVGPSVGCGLHHTYGEFASDVDDLRKGTLKCTHVICDGKREKLDPAIAQSNDIHLASELELYRVDIFYTTAAAISDGVGTIGSAVINAEIPLGWQCKWRSKASSDNGARMIHKGPAHMWRDGEADRMRGLDAVKLDKRSLCLSADERLVIVEIGRRPENEAYAGVPPHCVSYIRLQAAQVREEDDTLLRLSDAVTVGCEPHEPGTVELFPPEKELLAQMDQMGDGTEGDKQHTNKVMKAILGFEGRVGWFIDRLAPVYHYYRYSPHTGRTSCSCKSTTTGDDLAEQVQQASGDADATAVSASGWSAWSASFPQAVVIMGLIASIAVTVVRK